MINKKNYKLNYYNIRRESIITIFPNTNRQRFKHRHLQY